MTPRLHKYEVVGFFAGYTGGSEPRIVRATNASHAANVARESHAPYAEVIRVRVTEIGKLGDPTWRGQVTWVSYEQLPS